MYHVRLSEALFPAQTDGVVLQVRGEQRLLRLHIPEPVRRQFLEEKDQSNDLDDYLHDANPSRNRICTHTLHQWKGGKRYADDEEYQESDACPIAAFSNHEYEKPHQPEDKERNQHHECWWCHFRIH